MNLSENNTIDLNKNNLFDKNFIKKQNNKKNIKSVKKININTPIEVNESNENNIPEYIKDDLKINDNFQQQNNLPLQQAPLLNQNNFQQYQNPFFNQNQNNPFANYFPFYGQGNINDMPEFLQSIYNDVPEFLR